MLSGCENRRALIRSDSRLLIRAGAGEWVLNRWGYSPAVVPVDRWCLHLSPWFVQCLMIDLCSRRVGNATACWFSLLMSAIRPRAHGSIRRLIPTFGGLRGIKEPCASLDCEWFTGE